jgi:signal peptidase
MSVMHRPTNLLLRRAYRGGQPVPDGQGRGPGFVAGIAPAASSLSRAKSAWDWMGLGVLAWLVGVYLLVNLRLPHVLPAGANVYFGQPLAWLSLANLAYLGWRYGLGERPATDRRVIGMALLVGALQVALFVFAGLALGFGASPYSHYPLALMGNLFFMGTMLVGMEIGRAYLVVLLKRGSPVLAVAGVALLFACFSIPLGRYAATTDPPSFFEFAGETLLPAISQSLLATFLALAGGPAASIAYRIVPELFEWLSPILPNLSWTVSAFVGTMAPALGLLFVQRQLQWGYFPSGQRESREGESGNSWILVAVVTVSLLWFNTGLFGIRPNLVSGGSMSPALNPGDIVILRPVEPENIRVGDIIRVVQAGTPILHRVIEIRDGEGGRRFVTQGDANNVADEPVGEDQIDGRVVLVIPKIGWLAIGVRRALPWLNSSG